MFVMKITRKMLNDKFEPLSVQIGLKKEKLWEDGLKDIMGRGWTLRDNETYMITFEKKELE